MITKYSKQTNLDLLVTRRKGREEEEENNQIDFVSTEVNIPILNHSISQSLLLFVSIQKAMRSFSFSRYEVWLSLRMHRLNEASWCRVDDLISINVNSSLVAQQSEGSDKIYKGEPISSRRQQSQCSFG